MRRFSKHQSDAVLLFLFFALGMFKMRSYLIDGRFWAEEGAVYYQALVRLPAMDALLFVLHGHLELATNAVVWMATRVDFRYAPIVTVWASFLLQSIPVVVTIFSRNRLGLSAGAAAMFLLCVVGLPQSSEVWANSINLHFHFALLAGIIAAIPIGDNYPRHTFRILLLACGLSGIPANFLAPLFVALAVVHKDRERRIHALILLATMTLQLVLVVTNRDAPGALTERGISLQAHVLWLAIIAQQVIAPLFGVAVGERLATFLATALRLNVGALALAVLCSLPLVLLGRAAFSTKDKATATLFVAALLLAFCSAAAAVGGVANRAQMISAYAGGRYFFAPNCLLMLAAFIVASAPLASLRFRVPMIVVTLACTIGLGHGFRGKAWRAAFQEAVTGKAQTVEIWPPGWKMTNFALEHPGRARGERGPGLD